MILWAIMRREQRAKKLPKAIYISKGQENSCAIFEKRMKGCAFVFPDNSSSSFSSNLYLPLRHEHEYSFYGLKMCASQKYLLKYKMEEATFPLHKQPNAQRQQAPNPVYQSTIIKASVVIWRLKGANKGKNKHKFRYQNIIMVSYHY